MGTRLRTGSKIWVAGHRGLVGSALVRSLRARGHWNIVTRTHDQLDLTNAAATEAFLAAERPEYVFLAAARVGGILANDRYPADFVRENLAIQTNVLHFAWKFGVQRLLFLGSSCIYPRDAPQPIREEHFLSGPLEATNRAYAVAKIAGVEMCWSYNRQHGTRFLAAMPTNLYGPGDNYDADTSHVIPALIRRFDEARRSGASEVVVWGSGSPRREFLHSDDAADACVFLMELDEDRFTALLGSDESAAGRFEPPIVNVGVGEDLSIAELAEMIGEIVGFRGRVRFDTSRPDGTPRKLLDVTRLRSAGWSSSIPLRDGLAQTYELYRSRN